MSVDGQQQLSEALNGALHRLDYQFLGEDDRTTWWHRGKYPRDVQVSVQRSVLAPIVTIVTKYRNLHASPVQTGEIMAQIDSRGNPVDVINATETAVLRQLEIFRDVLQGTGVAGPEVLAGKPPVESTADSNMPETEEETQEVFGDDDGDEA